MALAGWPAAVPVESATGQPVGAAFLQACCPQAEGPLEAVAGSSLQGVDLQSRASVPSLQEVGLQSMASVPHVFPIGAPV